MPQAESLPPQLPQARRPALPVSATDSLATADALRRALILIQHDSLTAAARVLQDAIDVGPAHPLLYRYLGAVYERLDRLDEAIETYTSGLQSDADKDLLYARASLLQRRGDADRALADYTRLIEAHPQEADAYFFRAYLYMDKHDYKRARADYERTLTLQPQREDALIGLALLADKDRRPREAMERIDELIARYSTHATLYALRGGMKHQRRQYDEALADFNQAIDLAPTDADLYISRAALLTDMRRKKEARLDLRRAAELKRNEESKTAK